MENQQLLKELVKIAAADGVISNDERLALYRKADSLGFRVQDVDVLLAENGVVKNLDPSVSSANRVDTNTSSAHTNQATYTSGTSQVIDMSSPAGSKQCANCGDSLEAGICRSCGYESPEVVNGTPQQNEKLTRITAHLAGMNRREQQESIKSVILQLLGITITYGLYFIWRMLQKKPFIGWKEKNFSDDLGLLDAQLNSWKNDDGVSAAVRRQLAGYTQQRDVLVAQHSKKRTTRFFVFLIWVVLMFGLYRVRVNVSKNAAVELSQKKEKIENLINAHSYEAAEKLITTLDFKDQEAYREKSMENKILYEADNNQFAVALGDLKNINNYDREAVIKNEIYSKKIDFMIAHSRFDDARAVAADITDGAQQTSKMTEINEAEREYNNKTQSAATVKDKSITSQHKKAK